MAPEQQRSPALQAAPEAMQQRDPPASGAEHWRSARYEALQQSSRERQTWPTPEQQRLPPLGFGTTHEEAPMQHRLESEHRASGPEHEQVPPTSQAALQHWEPSVPEDPPHAGDVTPGCRQQVPATQATVVS